MVFGVFFGTLGTLKMSISSRRNTHFHVFDPLKCDLEIGPRKSWKKVRFGMDFGLHFWWLLAPKTCPEIRSEKSSEKSEKKAYLSVFRVRPGGMCGRRGETREGSRKAKLSDSWKKYLERIFRNSRLVPDTFCPARSSLPYGQGGGALRAIRRARSCMASGK